MLRAKRARRRRIRVCRFGRPRCNRIVGNVRPGTSPCLTLIQNRETTKNEQPSGPAACGAGSDESHAVPLGGRERFGGRARCRQAPERGGTGQPFLTGKGTMSRVPLGKGLAPFGQDCRGSSCLSRLCVAPRPGAVSEASRAFPTGPHQWVTIPVSDDVPTGALPGD
jgi:hypothetical protein